MENEPVFIDPTIIDIMEVIGSYLVKHKDLKKPFTIEEKWLLGEILMLSEEEEKLKICAVIFPFFGDDLLSYFKKECAGFKFTEKLLEMIKI